MLTTLSALFAERTRVWLTIVAIAWGTVSISLMLGIGEGLRQIFGKNMKEIGEGIMIVKPGMSNKSYRGQPQQRINFTIQDIQHLKALPDITTITPEYETDSTLTLRHGKQEYSTALIGVNPEYSNLRNIIPREPGRFINPLDEKQRSLVTVLGSDVATQLRVAENQVVTVNELPFKVIGITNHKRQMFAYMRPDDYLAWVPANTARAIWGDKLNTLVLKLNPQVNHEQVKSQITKIVALARGLSPNDDTIVHILDTKEMQGKVNQFWIGMEIFLGLAGALTLVVAGAGVANIMFASVSGAAQEIGIRKALGAQNYQILLHYIYQALLVTAMGGAIGIVVTFTMAGLINHLPLSGKLIENLGKPQLVLSTPLLAVIIATLGLIGLAAGFFPARRAANLAPVAALRRA